MAQGAKAKPVCFRTRDNRVVTFNATKTRAACDNKWDEYSIVRKRTSTKEAEALRRLKAAGVDRVPQLLYSSPKGRRAEVRMSKVGTALTDLGGRRGASGGKQLVKSKGALLRADLKRALEGLKRAGVLHNDVCPRNVTWTGDHFYLIDYDIVDFTRDWDVEEELEEAMDSLTRWAHS